MLCFIFSISVALTLQPNKSRGVIYGMNDTVLVTEVKRIFLAKYVAVKLSDNTTNSFHTVHIFTILCDKLSSHRSNSTVNIYSVNMPVDRPAVVMSPIHT